MVSQWSLFSKFVTENLEKQKYFVVVVGIAILVCGLVFVWVLFFKMIKNGKKKLLLSMMKQKEYC